MCATTRFVFGVELIDSLRADAKDGNYDENSKPLTRYEALAAFIWKHMTPACKMESNSTRLVVVIHIVDMRRRIGEPFSRYIIGNILWLVMVFCERVNAETSVRYLVNIAIDKFGNLSRELFLTVKRRDQENLPNEAIIMEIDEAIEAWLTMEMQHIANLEKDIEFLRLALPNPSVSNIWF
ncbi:hypothetical protein JHK87_047737 [Glycine soja]|nr:hypothetical protein JHK87_047737 [Glycine soja]